MCTVKESQCDLILLSNTLNRLLSEINAPNYMTVNCHNRGNGVNVITWKQYEARTRNGNIKDAFANGEPYINNLTVRQCRDAMLKLYFELKGKPGVITPHDLRPEPRYNYDKVAKLASDLDSLMPGKMELNKNGKFYVISLNGEPCRGVSKPGWAIEKLIDLYYYDIYSKKILDLQ